MKRPPTRLSLPPRVFVHQRVFFGPRVNALLEFSSFYFSRVCPLTFSFFPFFAGIRDFGMRSNRRTKLNTDQEFPLTIFISLLDFSRSMLSRLLFERLLFLTAKIIVITRRERKKSNYNRRKHEGKRNNVLFVKQTEKKKVIVGR